MMEVHSVCDVLVVGGGTAGTIAAIQAARAGVKTLLVEMGGQLGGTMTVGGVSFPGLFHAWGKQIIAGIGWELVKKTSDMEDRVLPDFSQTPTSHWHHQIRLNGSLYSALAEEACLEAGVELCYYELPVSAKRLAAGWKVRTLGKGLDRTIVSRQLIDCTGDADVVAMLRLPRLREKTTQPGSLFMKMGAYDATRLNQQKVQQRYEQAMAQARLKPGDHAYTQTPFLNFLKQGGYACHHLLEADGSTSIAKTRTNVEGRKSMLRLLRFIRTLPGCEQARLEWMQPETAVRETYRIQGRVRITLDDYVRGRIFKDAVCYAFYPVDLHTHQGVKPQPMASGVVPTVPLRALAPKGADHLLVAGRCLSSDRLANSALRVQAVCMAGGQAAGAAAALAARMKLSPLQVPREHLVALLVAHGAIVPAVY